MEVPNLEIVIRGLERFSEFRGAEELQKEVWGFEDRDLIPLVQLVSANEVGGMVLGAFDGDTLVGFAYGFLGCVAGSLVLHSEMTAVKPAYRNLGIGYKLKLAQRERVLAQGITRITWTFDPLQTLNAHFNFAKLGALADRYKIDFYGEATLSFLHSNGTDRLWLSWLLESRRVKQRLEGSLSGDAPSMLGKAVPLVRIGPNLSPQRIGSAGRLKGESTLIEVPWDIVALEQERPALATQWREATRWAFNEQSASGYLVEEFYRQNRDGLKLGIYLLTLRQLADFAGDENSRAPAPQMGIGRLRSEKAR